MHVAGLPAKVRVDGRLHRVVEQHRVALDIRDIKQVLLPAGRVAARYFAIPTAIGQPETYTMLCTDWTDIVRVQAENRSNSGGVAPALQRVERALLLALCLRIAWMRHCLVGLWAFPFLLLSMVTVKIAFVRLCLVCNRHPKSNPVPCRAQIQIELGPLQRPHHANATSECHTEWR